MFRRGFSLLLALLMCLSTIPVSTYAVEEDCICTELCGEMPNAECPHCAAGEVCAFSDSDENAVLAVSVTLDADELADYYGIRENGTTFEAVKFGCTSYIDCTNVESITLTMVNTKTSYRWGLAFYDAGKQFHSFVEQGNEATDLQSIEKTISVPEGAKYFRTTYYNFAYRQSTGHEFSCVLNYKEGYDPGRYRPYQEGCIYFSREVNQSLPEEEPEYKRTTGVLALPENYSHDGDPTKLIIYFHGYSHGVYMDHWGSTDTFRQQKQHFLD